MFNQDFYPTPYHVIEKMMYGVAIDKYSFLEPSAGKGDIVEYLQLHNAKSVIACEKDPNIKAILNTKCRIIAEDFLTVTSADISHIDCIVMNPPFSEEEKHILHAYEISPNGCHIISLCNYQMYANPFTSARTQLKTIIDSHGAIEDIGDCFSNAERKTNVSIGLIKIQKPGQSYSTEFEGFFTDDEPEEAQENGIMSYNLVREIVNRYVAAVKLFDQQIELGIQMNTLTNGVYRGKIAFRVTVDDAPADRTRFKKDLQKDAWQWIFTKMNMDKYTTKGLMADINKFVEQQQQTPFTMKNIYKMLEIVVGTTGQRMDRAIAEVFDKLTMHYDENRYNVEGWKTNSHYFMGEKFILPCIVSRYWNGGRMDISTYHNSNYVLLMDFVKALCYITGKNYDDITTLERYINDNKPEWGQWYDWHFFEIKGYKKGTMHFKFKNRDHWAMFNQHVARIKGYPLPEGFKKSA